MQDEEATRDVQVEPKARAPRRAAAAKKVYVDNSADSDEEEEQADSDFQISD